MVNINHKFKIDHYDAKFNLATYVYRVSEFQHHFEKIKVNDPHIATYLEEISVEKWSRTCFLGIQYNVMISNYVVRFNSKSKDTRKYPITIFADFLRFILQDQFYKRRGLVLTCNGLLAQDIEKNYIIHFSKPLHA